MPYYRALREPGQILADQLQQFGIPGYQVGIKRQQGTIIHFTRSSMVEEGSKFDFTFFVDDDIGGPMADMWQMFDVRVDGHGYEVPLMIKYLKQILDHDLNICGGVYPQRASPYLPTITKAIGFKDGREVRRLWIDQGMTGVKEVATCATGFLCIKQKVIDALADEFARRQQVVHRFNQQRALNSERFPDWLDEYLEIARPEITPPFWVGFERDPVTAQYTYLGEDVWFCLRARELGFKVYADFDVQLGHMSTVFANSCDYPESEREREAMRQAEIVGTLTTEDKEVMNRG